MKEVLASLAASLDALDRDDARRALDRPGPGVDFTSNDYLGLARDPSFSAEIVGRLRDAQGSGERLGTPSSRLLRGTTARHEALERRLAAWKGTEGALVLPSGYQANLGVVTALVGPGDRVLSDARNHASLIDGIRLARCHKEVLPGGDLGALDTALATPFPGRTFVVTESLYSMDGEVAPLAAIADRCEDHGAALIVDDAHATGLFGDTGAGWVEQAGVACRALAIVSTCGKALGVSGAFVAGPALVIDHLINRCRPFVFSTAVSPLLLVALDTALDRVAAEPWRRRRVLQAAATLRAALQARGVRCGAGEGPIVPVVLGDNRRTLAVAAGVRALGFDVRAIRPPTVPEGTARLRLSVHADHEDSQLESLADAVAEALWRVDAPASAVPVGSAADEEAARS